MHNKLSSPNNYKGNLEFQVPSNVPHSIVHLSGHLPQQLRHPFQYRYENPQMGGTSTRTVVSADSFCYKKTKNIACDLDREIIVRKSI